MHDDDLPPPGRGAQGTGGLTLEPPGPALEDVGDIGFAPDLLGDEGDGAGGDAATAPHPPSRGIGLSPTALPRSGTNAVGRTGSGGLWADEAAAFYPWAVEALDQLLGRTPRDLHDSDNAATPGFGPEPDEDHGEGGDVEVGLPTANPAPGDPAPGDPAPGDPAPGDPAPGDPAPGDPAPGDPAPGDPAPGDPAPGDPAPGDPAPGDPAPGDPAPDDAANRSPTGAPSPSPLDVDPAALPDRLSLGPSITHRKPDVRRPPPPPAEPTDIDTTDSQMEDMVEMVLVGGEEEGDVPSVHLMFKQEYLGGLYLKLERTPEGLFARFSVKDANTRRAVEGHVDMLLSRLRDKGMRIAGHEVVVGE